MNPVQKFKQKMWRIIYPIFPKLEKVFLPFHEKTRQRYHLGWLAPGKTFAGLKKHLSEKWGFGNHFVAWEDDSQVLSWRRLENFNQQYHLRVFSDGELRGHFEFTPEGHPLEHFEEKGEEDRTADFMKFLGDFVTTKKHISHLVRDPHPQDPDSEITYKQP